MNTAKSWEPPFASDDTDLTCPKCGVSDVQVRAQDGAYYDGFEYEAYCAECHVLLEVTASVDVSFHDPEVVE